MVDGKDRFLIVGAGRSGSSLLAAVLAHAGADFRAEKVTTWNRQSGAYEDMSLYRAHSYQRLAGHLPIGLQRFRRVLLKRRDAILLRALEATSYAKATPLVWLTSAVDHLGFKPKIILSYRHYNAYFASRFRRSGMTFPELCEAYVTVYSTAILQIKLYGGVCVDYEQLCDLSQSGWAEALANLTSMDRVALLRARAELARPVSPGIEMPDLDRRVGELYSLMGRLSGTVIAADAGESKLPLGRSRPTGRDGPAVISEQGCSSPADLKEPPYPRRAPRSPRA